MTSQKILIIDDSKTIRMQIMDMLPKGNFEVLEAGDGVEGLELIGKELPHLILLDFFMPRMNGWEVVQQMQTRSELQSIPVVMMSGRREDVEESVPELFEYFEFINKPFEQGLLVQAIRSAMAKAKQRRQLAAQPAAVGTPKAAQIEQPVQQPVDTASPSADVVVLHSGNSQEVQILKAEVQQLRQQNMKLKAEVDGLKKQVNQIMLFIRQKAKSL